MARQRPACRPRLVGAAARNRSGVTFILQSFAFCLIGLEIPEVFRRLGSDEVALVLVLVPMVLVTLVGTRFLFVGLMVVIERSRDRREASFETRRSGRRSSLPGKGARGPVSDSRLSRFRSSSPAVNLSYRDVFLATTFAIIVISLLLTLSVAPLARWLGVRGDDDAALARTVDSALARAALERLDAAVSESDASGERIAPELLTDFEVTAKSVSIDLPCRPMSLERPVNS